MEHQSGDLRLTLINEKSNYDDEDGQNEMNE